MKETIKNILNSITSLLKIKDTPNFGTPPSQLVVLTRNREGISVIRATNKVLEKKRELGIPTGNLVDGSANSDDILWYTAINAIIEELTEHAKITTAISAGQQIVASGANSGGPVVCYGNTITFGVGGTIIE
jgi:hypothetical protein